MAILHQYVYVSFQLWFSPKYLDAFLQIVKWSDMRRIKNWTIKFLSTIDQNQNEILRVNSICNTGDTRMWFIQDLNKTKRKRFNDFKYLRPRTRLIKRVHCHEGDFKDFKLLLLLTAARLAQVEEHIRVYWWYQLRHMQSRSKEVLLVLFLPTLPSLIHGHYTTDKQTQGQYFWWNNFFQASWECDLFGYTELSVEHTFMFTSTNLQRFPCHSDSLQDLAVTSDLT